MPVQRAKVIKLKATNNLVLIDLYLLFRVLVKITYIKKKILVSATTSN